MIYDSANVYYNFKSVRNDLLNALTRIHSWRDNAVKRYQGVHETMIAAPWKTSV